MTKVGKAMAAEERAKHKKVILVGNPNVGKSVIFRLLTGNYVLVSNFPGTTVEVSRGRISLGGISYEIIDTPGVHSLVPQSEDERVTCEMLLKEKPDLIVQVADAKNLRRTLLVASQLVEFGYPMVLVMNMMDEAQERGIEIDTAGLAGLLSIPIVETVAIYSQGKRQLLQAIQNATVPSNPLNGGRPTGGRKSPIEDVGDIVPAALATEWLSLKDRGFTRRLETLLGQNAVRRLEENRKQHAFEHRRSAAREIAGKRNDFLDHAVAAYKKKRQTRFLEQESGTKARIWLMLLVAGLLLFAWNEIGSFFGAPTPYSVATGFLTRRLGENQGFPGQGIHGVLYSVLLGRVSSGRIEFGLVLETLHFLFFIAPVVVPFAVLIASSRRFTYEVGVLTRRAVTGIPILACVLLLVYEFVGYTGAQTLVGFFEDVIFGRYLIPALQSVLPAGFFYDFIAGRYGLVSMGLTYAIAIVLPVVSTFFIAFGLLEDSGYLPRLSILSDRIMRWMGLNGKATLPMVLGLGCCTMATITTRVLSSRKERLIATLLLALGIPCSAQLGVILGISAGFSPAATLTVLAVVASQVLLVGFISSRLIRGQGSEFIFEIPPIRVPQFKNVALKTGYRLQWYLKEALPLFLYGTIALFTLDRIHLYGRSLMVWLEAGLAPVLSGILHVPPESAGVYVLGFLRRDYGAAGLFDMVKSGSLTPQQAVVSLIVITLFVPCLASFLVIGKEQGIKRAIAITAFILPFSIAVGGIVSWVLRTFEITFR